MTRTTLFRLALTAFLLVVVAAPARAGNPLPILLTWNAPPECPTRDSVVSAIDRILGSAGRRATKATVTVENRGEGVWSVHLLTEAEGLVGERSFEATSCASIADATALIVAWTLDIGHALAPSPAPPPTAVVPVDRASGVERVAPTRPARPVASRMRGVVALSGALDVGMLPRVGAGAALAAGVLVGPVRLELAGTDWADESTMQGSEGAHLHAFEVQGRACFRGFIGPKVEVDPCLEGGAVIVGSTGFGESVVLTRETAWPTVGAGILAQRALWGPFGVRALLGADTPLSRPAFVIVDASNHDVLLHRPSPIGGRASLGLEIDFP